MRWGTNVVDATPNCHTIAGKHGNVWQSVAIGVGLPRHQHGPGIAERTEHEDERSKLS